MFIEMLWASMLTVLGLFGLYVKVFHKSAASLGSEGRYRNYRKERREAFLLSLRKVVLKNPHITLPEDLTGLHPGRAMLL
jgi:hypothetical protein